MVFSAQSIEDGHVFVDSETGGVYSLDQETEEPVWRYKTGGPNSMTPAVADGKVYVGSRDGYVYCFGRGPTATKIVHIDSK